MTLPPEQLEKFKAMLKPQPPWGRWKILGVTACIRLICSVAAVAARITR